MRLRRSVRHYEAANERRLPILFHTFGQDHQFAQVDEIARRYPDASILVAHLRTMNEEGYHRIAREHPNVFVDTVGSGAARGLVERAVAAIGANKIVWGSDAYCYGCFSRFNFASNDRSEFPLGPAA